MDAAGRMELVRDLCSIAGRGSGAGRGPGTDAERRAASMLAERLRGLGRRVRVEPTFVHPNYALVHALHATMALAGSIVATWQPAVGFALVLAAATSTYLDLNTRAYLIRRLFFRRASQNVVSPGSSPDAPLRVLLVAHYDAARSGWIFGRRWLGAARRLPERARVALGPWRLVFWAGMAPLLPILGARMAGIDEQWVSILQLPSTLLLVIAVFLLIDIALSDQVPGAYDNASGVAAVLSVADELREQPAEHLDVWVVLTGAHECLSEGMRSFLREHKDELDRDRTVVVNVDAVSYGVVHYDVSDGPVVSLPTDPSLVELCEAIATAEPAFGARPVRAPLGSDALAARLRRFRSTTIRGLDSGLPPRWQHAPDDTPEHVDSDAMDRATGFVSALVRLLDRDAGRASQAAPARETV